MSDSIAQNEDQAILADCFDRYQGLNPVTPDSSISQESYIDLMVQRWHEFHRWLGKTSQQSSFVCSLSKQQYESYVTIKEFFDCTWYDQKDTAALIQAHPVSVKDEEAADDSDSGTSDDMNITYVLAIATLFQHEMLREGLPVGHYAIRVHESRLRATEQARAQKIGYSFLASHRQGLDINSAHQIMSSSGSTWGGPVWRATDGVPAPATNEWPYYLWDISERRTIEAQQLIPRPDYTCISHTWGRWEILQPRKVPGVPWLVPQNSRFNVQDIPDLLQQSAFRTKHVWLDLVCIPQGQWDPTRQAEEIAKQAGIFVNAKQCIAWWNDVTSWDTLLPSISWLGLAYLRDHSGLSFTGIDEAIEVFQQRANESSNLFQKKRNEFAEPLLGTYDPTQHLEEDSRLHARFCCSSNVDDCLIGRRMRKRRRSEPSLRQYSSLFEWPDWLSSLWTLQEACLCPDMNLACSSLRTYLQTPTKLPITLKDLITLIDLVTHPSTRSAKQLRECFARHFDASHPLDVILMGNERQCTGQRAPAIMSVLGVTDWYRAQITLQREEIPGDGALVLGKYPLQFVQEAATKIGPLFFATCPNNCMKDGLKVMLPFSEGGNIFAFFPCQKYPVLRRDAQHLPWTICVDGGVMIKKAIIVASSNEQISPVAEQHPLREAAEQQNLKASVFGMEITLGDKICDGEVPLQEVLDVLCQQTNAKDAQAFALHLTQDVCRKIGILLVGSPSEMSNGSMVLKKRAVYIILHSQREVDKIIDSEEWPEMPQARSVDWIAY